MCFSIFGVTLTPRTPCTTLSDRELVNRGLRLKPFERFSNEQPQLTHDILNIRKMCFSEELLICYKYFQPQNVSNSHIVSIYTGIQLHACTESLPVYRLLPEILCSRWVTFIMKAGVIPMLIFDLVFRK